jgi:hypothetical protein
MLFRFLTAVAELKFFQLGVPEGFLFFVFSVFPEVYKFSTLFTCHREINIEVNFHRNVNCVGSLHAMEECANKLVNGAFSISIYIWSEN